LTTRRGGYPGAMKTMSHPLAEIGDVVTSGVSDAWATTSALAQELAATAANAIDVVHPKPAKSRLNPWLLVVAGIAAVLTAGWWMRRQQSMTTDTSATWVSPTAAPAAPSPTAATA
jgi:hypothetical protein